MDCPDTVTFHSTITTKGFPTVTATIATPSCSMVEDLGKIAEQLSMALFIISWHPLCRLLPHRRFSHPVQ
jgi:hypothetical protein